MNIGKRYDKHNYNCAHYVADWYKTKLDIDIPVINEFDRSFLIWMRRNFTDCQRPVNHCLVLMVESSGDYHIGVYYDQDVYHNYKPSMKAGGVTRTRLGTIRRNYSKVTFHTWSTLDSIPKPVVKSSNNSGLSD